MLTHDFRWQRHTGEDSAVELPICNMQRFPGRWKQQFEVELANKADNSYANIAALYSIV